MLTTRCKNAEKSQRELISESLEEVLVDEQKKENNTLGVFALKRTGSQHLHLTSTVAVARYFSVSISMIFSSV